MIADHIYTTVEVKPAGQLKKTTGFFVGGYSDQALGNLFKRNKMVKEVIGTECLLEAINEAGVHLVYSTFTNPKITIDALYFLGIDLSKNAVCIFHKNCPDVVWYQKVSFDETERYKRMLEAAEVLGFGEQSMELEFTKVIDC
jgi:hypothetical protein